MGDDWDSGDLEPFLRKALELQLSEPGNRLSEEALKAVALRAGLSEADWDRIGEQLEAHLARGRNALKFGNHEDARRELDQVVVLAPYRADVLVDGAEAHRLHWKASGEAEARQRAKQLYEKGLRIEPGNALAAEGLSELVAPSSGAAGRELPSKGKLAALGSLAAVLMVASGVFAWKGLTVPESAPEPVISKRSPTAGLAGRPDDAVPFGSRYYKAFSVEKMGWYEAMRECERLGGRLAFVPDSETHEFLVGIAEGKRVWLGATDEEEEGAWRWLDGSPVQFERWATGGRRVPDNYRDQEHYLMMNDEGLWNDARESGPTGVNAVQGFICEWDGTGSD